MVEIMHSNILELAKMRQQAAMGGGEPRNDAQHHRGKLTARERIDLLLDEGSFEELDMLKVGRADTTGAQGNYPGDGVITGTGASTAARSSSSARISRSSAGPWRRPLPENLQGHGPGRPGRLAHHRAQ